MPVTEDRLYRPDRLNRWFAVSSIIMTISIAWLIQVDYDRPWKDFQDRYFVGKAALAHLDYLDAAREQRVAESTKAERRVQDERELLDQTSGARLATLQSDLATADLEFRKADAPYSKASQVLEVTKDTYERKLGASGAEHPETIAAHQQFQIEEDDVDRLRKEKERWEDEKRRIAADLRELEKGVRTAEKALLDLRQVAESALSKDRAYRGVLEFRGGEFLGGLPIVRGIINMPLLDFTAPKNTPARHQVNQLVLPDVRQRLNYLESYTTDRCTTCHVAIDDPEFSKGNLARKLERSLPGVMEAMQRAGKTGLPLPQPPTLHGTESPLPPGKVTDHWDELAVKQQDDYFQGLLAVVNDYLKQTGRKAIELGQPVLAHPNLELYVSVDSPHAQALMGCTVCHEGNPQETDFVQAAHSPPTHEAEERWADEYYISELGVPNVTFETIAHYWDRPMRLPQHTEAGCAKCHAEITDIDRFRGERVGARINLGQHLFREVGCINCHNVEDLKESRRVGPDLRHVGSKLTAPFVQQWAFFPQKFRPSTRMPHFFAQENNRAESRNQFDTDPVLRTQTEVAAISRYLFATSAPWKPAERPPDLKGDPQRGRELFKSVGCLACHSNIQEFGEQWITEDLMQREGLGQEKALYRYNGMTLNERVRYAEEHFHSQTESFFQPENARFDPEKKYNKPTFSRFAPELSGIGSKSTEAWLYAWLLDPSKYAKDTKMPSLRLTPAEAADIASYLMTLKNDEFEQHEFPMDSAALRMSDDLIFSLLASQRSERRSRAIMHDDGGELTRMLVGLLADSFAEGVAAELPRAVGDAERRKLGEGAAYDVVSPMSLQDKKLTYLGSKMIGHYGCYACHMIRGFEKTTPPGTDLTTWSEKPVTQLDFAFFGDAFHGMREEKEEVFGYVYPQDGKELNDWSPIDDRAREQIRHTHAAFAKHKMLNPRIWDREKIKKPYDKLKMPNFYFTEEESEALTTYLVSRVPPRVSEKLAVDYDTDLLGPIARGRFLTRELNCIACHQIEDNAPLVQQFYRRKQSGRLEFDLNNAPPLLWGEGAKLQHNWFHRFVQHVEPLRPWLQIRMPSFKLTGEQRTTLVEYFAALSRQDSSKLAGLLAPIDEYLNKASEAAASRGGPAEPPAPPTKPGSDWFEEESLRERTAGLRRWAVERKLVRAGDVDPLTTAPERLRNGYAQMLARIRFLKDLYNVEYPFVEPAAPLSPEAEYAKGQEFFTDMGCLKCHILGPMLPGPAKSTDDFTNVYRLDGVRGEGEGAAAIINGTTYPVGVVIDGCKLISATNVYYDTGDVETKAIFEGPNAAGQTERIVLQAPSAPNLGLTNQRLRRAWVFDWMLSPQLIQPGTKMPQNFPGGESPYKGDAKYPGTGMDHINLLVDYLYDAGTKAARSPLQKVVAPSGDESFEESKEFED